MIIVDIETSGLDPENKGIWQIGAIEFENPKNTFLQEARIDDLDSIEDEALKVTGKTIEELRDKNKQSQQELLKNFFEWASKTKNKIFVAHNTPFDYYFLLLRAKKYSLIFPFHYRTFDLHNFAVMKYFNIKKSLPVEEEKSKMNLSEIINFCGLKDNRISLKDGKVIKEGEPHNALQDAKIEAECFSRILYGKSLLKEFKNFNVPDELKIG